MLRLARSFSPLTWAVGLVLVQFLVLVSFVGQYPVGGSSEARELHVAQVIKRTGDWILPLRDGLLPSKPPLFHWITAALGTLRGDISPAVGRATSLVFGCAALLLTGLLALRAAGSARGAIRQRRPLIAMFACFLLATSYGFQNVMADARVDMTYCFFVVAAIAPIFDALCRESAALAAVELRRRWRWDCFFAAAGFGVLAKGPVAIVIPGLVVVAFLIADMGVLRGLRFFLLPRRGWIAFFLLALPWYGLASIEGGSGFIERQILFENVRRFTGGEAVNTEAWWYYAPSFLRTALPWSLFFIAGSVGLLAASYRRTAVSVSYPGEARALRFAALWFWVGVIFLSFASGKRHSYLLPLYPAVALFLSVWFSLRVFDSPDSRISRVLVRTRGVQTCLAVLILFVMAGFDILTSEAYPLRPLAQEARVFLEPFAFWAQWSLFAAALLLLWCTYRKCSRPELNAFAVFASLVVLVSTLVYAGLAVKNFYKGFDRAAGKIVTLVPATAPLVVVREPREEFFDSLLFYLGREAELLAVGALADRCPEHLVIREIDMVKIAATHVIEPVARFAPLPQIYRGRGDDGYVLARCLTRN